ncbi:MAG: caspase family protein [Oleiphilus sp.]
MKLQEVLFKTILISPLVMLLGCQTLEQESQPLTMQERVSRLQVVDCLLPGQVRMIGSQSYQTPRRPTKTTASDCEIRGGEYVAYDRANYKTALTVWMPQAEAGDAEAQANVGEIFERGLGGTPNYTAAKIWYEKAAAQGNKSAQFNLGTLYEQGLGVEKNMVMALNWYRQAWDLPADDLMYQSVYQQESEKLRHQLDQQLERKNRQISILQKQVNSLQAKAENDAAMQQEIAELNLMIADLKKEQQNVKNKQQTTRLRQPTVSDLANTTRSVQTETKRELMIDDIANKVAMGDKEFGRYYALIIGNQDYQNIDSLVTPRNDIQRLGDVLETRYGFNVTRLNDSDNLAIMDAINNLNDVLTEYDNLLIYYAGHGNRIQTGDFETGYWLPVNADAPPRDSLWIPNEFVTRHLARIEAKRVMVIADSCYAGLLSSAPGFLMLADNEKPSDDYVRYKLPRKSRLLLTSGGDFPVLDSGGGDNSVFANALLDLLEQNKGLITAPEIYRSVRDRVSKDAKVAKFDQTPVYKVIKGAGHEMGDFFFVPVNSES